MVRSLLEGLKKGKSLDSSLKASKFPFEPPLSLDAVTVVNDVLHAIFDSNGFAT